jgi:hypothetical protein
VNTPAYDKGVTALLVVDPYNDFISEGGKIWPRIKAVAEAMRRPHVGGSRRLGPGKAGDTLRPFRKGHGNTGPSNSAHGGRVPHRIRAGTIDNSAATSPTTEAIIPLESAT